MGEIVDGILGYLAAVRVDFLLEVAVFVEQTDAEEGHGHVRGGLEVVAGQHAQAAGINGHGFIDAVFGGKIGYRVFRRQMFVERAQGLGHVAVEFHQHLVVEAHVLLIANEVGEAFGISLFQHPDGIMAFFPELRVEGHEQGLGLVMPAPPEIGGKLAQAGQSRGHFRHGHDGPQKGRHGTGGREDAVQAFAPLAVMTDTRVGFFQGQLEGIDIMGEKVAPGGSFGQSAGVLAPHGHSLGSSGGGLQYAFVQGRHALLEIHAAPGHHMHAGVRFGLFPGHLSRPHAEAREIRGQGGHGPGRAFLRGVAPGFVPGGEKAHVAGRNDILVGHVQEAVVAVQHGRHKDDLDAPVASVVQAQTAAGVDDGILRGVPGVMGADEGLAIVCGVGIAGHSRLIDARVPAHDQAERQNGRVRTGQIAIRAGQGFQKDVHALVVHLITAGNGKDAGLLRQLAAQEAFRGFPHSGAVLQRFLAFLRKIGDHPQVQAIDRDDVGLAAQKNGGFLAGDGAYRGKGVGLARRGAFHGPLGRDVLRGGLMGGIDVAQVAVNVAPGSGQGAAQHGGVGGEYRGHGRSQLFHAQQARAAHPFVKERYGAPAQRLHQAFMDGRDHLAAGRGEHDRLNVVPTAGQGVHAVVFPDFVQQLIAAVTLGKIHQNGLGAARYVPAAQATFEILGAEGQTQGIPDVLVCFFKTGALLHGRAQQKVVLAKGFHGLERLAADDGINAPDLVADFPAYLKERDRSTVEIHERLLVAPPLLEPH